MHLSERKSMSIKKRQNEEMLLKVQYAARYKYNFAELLNKICFWLSFSPLFFLLPFIAKIEKIAAATLIIDVVILILSFCVRKLVMEAATLRKYFDNCVFGFGNEDVNTSRVEETALQIFNKRLVTSTIQINNTAQDTPPGVKDWYDISEDVSEEETIYKCQCENGWWTQKMFMRLVWKYLVYFGIVVIIFLILKIACQVSCFDIFIAISGVFLKFVERIIALIQYAIVSFKAEGAIAILKVYNTNEQLKCLQGFINERRAIPILLPNNTHRKMANWWAYLYHKTHLIL